MCKIDHKLEFQEQAYHDQHHVLNNILSLRSVEIFLLILRILINILTFFNIKKISKI